MKRAVVFEVSNLTIPVGADEPLNLKQQETARVVELSEANAYRSLAGSPSDEVRRQLGLSVVSVGGATVVMAESIDTTLNLNRVIGLGIEQPATEAEIDQIVKLYSEKGLRFGVEVSPLARPEQLPQWLRTRRIRRGLPTAMHCRRAEYLDDPNQTVAVVRADTSQRDLVADICCTAFKLPTVARAVIASTAFSTNWRQWLAFANGAPIGAALSFVGGDTCWIGWDATIPEARGRGVQSSLIVHRVNDAARAGCRFVTAETDVIGPANSGISFRNYARNGFETVYERLTYVSIQVAKGARPTAVSA